MASKKFTAMKIKVPSSKRSSDIQKILFALGYSWALDGDQKVRNCTASYIYAHTNGTITYGNMSSTFREKKHEEYAPETRIVLTKVQPPEKIITLFGVDYTETFLKEYLKQAPKKGK